MERYSTLYGTTAAGPYDRLGSSKQLGHFLTQKIGAANIKDTVELTERIMKGIEMLPGYEKETLVNKPLAVVYAPLYLEKKPGMAKGMKGFCALSVSGLEHRSDAAEKRETNFYHTWFFPREEMLAGGEYNYLDLLMGTPLTTSQDVNLHRAGALPVNLERAPEKVQPQLNKKDLATVLTAVDALYQKKNVVLILEAGANFNRRSMELLTQIYSVMQPVMATETGFATYQSQKRILDLSADTNVQIYVVPAGSDLSALPAAKFQIMDAARPVKPQETAVLKTLLEWAKLDWKARVRAMYHLFAKSTDYSNAEQFVKLSQEFFAQAQDLSAWMNDTSKHKTIATLTELRAEDKTESGWRLVPWAKEAFDKKYPMLLKEGSVDVLNARNIAAFYEYNGADAALKSRSAGAVDAAEVNKAVQEYQYGRKLAGANEAELCRLIWEKADNRVGVGYRAALADKDAQMADKDARHKQELDVQAKKFADREAEFETAWNNRENTFASEKEDAVKAEQANTAAVQEKLDTQVKKFADRETEFKTAWDNRESTFATEKEAAVKAEQANTAAVQEKLDAADQVRIAEVEKVKQQARTRIEGLKTENQNLQNDLTQANADKQNLQNGLNQANADKQNLQNSLSQANADRQNLQNSLNRANGDKQELQNKLTQVGSHMKTLQSNLDQVTQQYRQVTGQEPVKPEPKIKIGPFELPKAAVPLLAVIAAAALLLGGLVGALVRGLFIPPVLYDVQWSVNGQLENANGMGTVALSAEAVEAGESVTVTVIPAEGFKLDDIKLGSGAALVQSSETKYTFEMPERDEQIVVTFSELPPPVPTYEVTGTVAEGGEGTVTLSTASAQAGQTVTVTVIPAEGWQLDEVKAADGTELTKVSDTEYTFVMPEQAQTITAAFSKIPVVFNEDGTISWECLMETVPWVKTAETNADEMAKILGENAIKAEGWEQTAVLLPEGWSAEAEEKTPYVLLLHSVTGTADGTGTEGETGTEDQQTPPAAAESAALELLKKGWLVLDNGEWCVVIPAEAAEAQSNAWIKAMRAAKGVMDHLNLADDGLLAFAYMLEDGRVIDLKVMSAAANMADDWWTKLDKISFDPNVIAKPISRMKTGATAVMAIVMEDDFMGLVFDYKDSDKGDEMVSLATGKGRSTSHVGDFVLVMLNGDNDQPFTD